MGTRCLGRDTDWTWKHPEAEGQREETRSWKLCQVVDQDWVLPHNRGVVSVSHDSLLHSLKTGTPSHGQAFWVLSRVTQTIGEFDSRDACAVVPPGAQITAVI